MNHLFKNWNFIRIIRLIIGVGSVVYGIIKKDYLFLFVGGILIFQSVLNVSCCGAGGCSTSTKEDGHQVYKDQIEQYKNKDVQ